MRQTAENVNKFKGLLKQAVIMGASASSDVLVGSSAIAAALGVHRGTVHRWQRRGLIPRWKVLPRQMLMLYLGQLALTSQQAVAVSTHSPEGGGLVPGSRLLAPTPSRCKKVTPKGFADAPVVVIE